VKKLSSLTIFFPALNDARSLPYLINRAFTVAESVAKKFEVIIIDDGSTDETPEVLTTALAHYKNLRIIRHAKNMGYGAALQDGFTHAKYSWIFYTDGDGQYDPSELKLLVPMVTSTIDVVNGYKLHRSDSFMRKVIGSLYNNLSHTEYTLPIRDVQCDFRLIRKSAMKKFHLTATSGLVCLELVLKLTRTGARFVEVGVRHYPRMFGHSQFFRPANLWRTFIEHVGLFVRFMKRQHEKGKKYLGKRLYGTI
jgi:glycosyltransferase involved in cell wall biosynthesis